MHLTRPALPRGTAVAAWGHYQPPTVLTNDDLVDRGLDSSDEWIRSRVGIIERRVAEDGQTLLDLAERAGADALAKSGLGPDDIDLVIFATCTASTQLQVGAVEIAHRLGITAPGAYNLNAACAGFVYGVSAASDAILAGQARNVLVIGADKFSDWLDWTERSTAILFADGAGAGVVTAHPSVKIGPVVWGSDGLNSQAIRIDDETATIRQDGQTVYRWATGTMGDVARRVCERTGVDPSELAVFVPHQANLRIINLIAKKLGATNAIVADDVVVSGNTSAASIPIAMSKLLADNAVPSGAPMLILGFGAGLTYAGQIVLAP